MILHWDGSYPLIFIIVAICCYFYCSKKNKKYTKNIEKEQELLSQKIQEIDNFYNLLNAGQIIFNKNDFNHIDDREIKSWINTYNVKFI